MIFRHHYINNLKYKKVKIYKDKQELVDDIIKMIDEFNEPCPLEINTCISYVAGLNIFINTNKFTVHNLKFIIVDSDISDIERYKIFYEKEIIIILNIEYINVLNTIIDEIETNYLRVYKVYDISEDIYSDKTIKINDYLQDTVDSLSSDNHIYYSYKLRSNYLIYVLQNYINYLKENNLMEEIYYKLYNAVYYKFHYSDNSVYHMNDIDIRNIKTRYEFPTLIYED